MAKELALGGSGAQPDGVTALKMRLRDEHRSDQVEMLYQLLLGRRADPYGLTYWSGRPEASLRDISEEIIASPEFRSKHPVPLKPTLDASLEVRTVNGVLAMVPASDAVYGHARSSGIYEPHVSAAICDHLNIGATFLDIGANIGIHTLAASQKVGPGGLVFAVDASVENCNVLAKSLSRFDVGNVIIIPAAVGSHQGAEFISTASNSSNQTVRRDVQSSPGRPILVQTVDALLSHVARVDLVKIDVEGREAGVLRGARGLIERSRCPIVAEYLGRNAAPYSADEGHFTDELCSAGYRPFVIEATGGFMELDGSPEAFEQALEQARHGGGDHIDLLFKCG